MKIVHEILEQFIARVKDMNRLRLDVFFRVFTRRRRHHLTLAHAIGATERGAKEDDPSDRVNHPLPFVPVEEGIGYRLGQKRSA